jgi:hypothetical protein
VLGSVSCYQHAAEYYVDEEGNASKPLYTEGYNSNVGFVDMSDVMFSSYSISWTTWKWTRKLFFHVVDLRVLNNLYNSQLKWGAYSGILPYA